MFSSSMPPTATHWRGPRILSEQLVPVPEPFTIALAAGAEAPPRDVVGTAARALLDGGGAGAPLAPGASPDSWPPWLAPHQVPAAQRLSGIIARHGGALLADAVGLG